MHFSNTYTNSMSLQAPFLFHTAGIHKQKNHDINGIISGMLKAFPMIHGSTNSQLTKRKHIHNIDGHNGSSLLSAIKVKCAIKFMRALITNFHITSLIRKVDKNMNIFGIAIMLVGRYGGLFGITWFYLELDA